jgi:pimeloyl-ACP methyl ester carboxylesterase
MIMPKACTNRAARLAGTAAVALLLGMVAPSVLYAQNAPAAPAFKTTYMRLPGNANALLTEAVTANAKSRIVVINVHPGKINAFEYPTGRQLAARGYRQIGVNYYGPEVTFEELLPPIGAAVKWARSLPGVEKVVLVGHSGGGPELSYYAEIAEKGPSACQRPNRLYKCDPKGLENLPKVDGIVIMEANVGAPHRSFSIDPAVSDNSRPKVRNPALDMYAAANGFRDATNSATYSDAFKAKYFAGQHDRSQKLIAEAQARLKAIDAHSGQYNDNEPWIIGGMAENSAGARLNMADGTLLAETHGAHLHLKADGTTPVEIARSTRKPAATPVEDRDTLEETTQFTTVRHFLSYLAVTTTADYAMTRNDIKGVDWSSSANSVAGNLENITIPTLVMAGSCTIHMVPLEIAFDHSAAKDKEFVVVEGGDHAFRACRPEFGDSLKKAYDHVDNWLNKRF